MLYPPRFLCHSGESPPRDSWRYIDEELRIGVPSFTEVEFNRSSAIVCVILEYPLAIAFGKFLTTNCQLIGVMVLPGLRF